MPEVPASLPWWRSRVIIGVIVSILCKALVGFGAIDAISLEDERQLADAALLIIGGVGDLVALTARVRQKHAPSITATKKAA